MTRLLICGTHRQEEMKVLLRALARISPLVPTVIIEGGAKGIDALANRYARARGIPFEQYRAAWEQYGKQAGPLRNTRMLVEGHPEAVLAIPDRASRGTWNMLKQAKDAGLPCYQFMYEDLLTNV